MKLLTAFLFLGAQLAQAAINLDGSQAVWASEEGPSPIGTPDTYIPEQHNCPVACVDYANIHSWISYPSLEHLSRCTKPLLLQFSVTQPLDDPNANTLIRSCSLAALDTEGPVVAYEDAITVENPKKDDALYRSSLEYAPACSARGINRNRTNLEVRSSAAGASTNHTKDDGGALLKNIRPFFDAQDNCDENFVFASHKSIVISIYIGDNLGKATVAAALNALEARWLSQDDSLSSANQTVVQLCGNDRTPDQVFGIAIDTTGDLAAVQRLARGWSQGECANSEDLVISKTGLPDVDVWGIPQQTANRINKRDTCEHIKVEPGNGCAELVERCPGDLSVGDFERFNPKPNLCATLMPGDAICCSEGSPPEEPQVQKPVPGEDGTCATHLIENGDSCASLATLYGVTVDEIEDWNKNKTWAWTECKDMLVGYNLCVSDGSAPMPPPQAGTECGPLVPGTVKPSGLNVSIADLNPCPLKACCSNWGFCGVFPQHCDVHAPAGGGPGSKEKGFQYTCVSNCGTEIKQNSGPPTIFQRIGYYESWNLGRECLWMKAKDANTDGTYTHMHWGFGDIDPNGWKPVIKDPHGQWADFKALPNTKRIVSFGGWAYSTEAATYQIIRQAIIDNRETFAENLARFVRDEGIDGIDIDWEYPGAPDIMVGDQPIGQKGDGIAYLEFLTTLKEKLGPDKLVSIAAPASYWYLKAFPIDSIAKVIDYIVYMTYDLHGQWDYGNPNSFDNCPSGKCIRSHVNLTETANSLGMITKAGVPNNKIFVGEASYGRSFRMAQDGCWGPMCEFTGSRTKSDAIPGRCTKEGGYVALAEISELLKRADDGALAQLFHDHDSNSDIALYKGDYISYMTPLTKDTRRNHWMHLNFAGTIDWAVDLQRFGQEDMDRDSGGVGGGGGGTSDGSSGDPTNCVAGTDRTVDSGDLCEFTCDYGFCPDTLCMCQETDGPGEREELPQEVAGDGWKTVTSWDDSDVELTRLCRFSCRYGHCPEDICTQPPREDDGNQDDTDMITVDDLNEYYNYEDVRWQAQENCVIIDSSNPNRVDNSCEKFCKPQTDAAKEEGRTTNWGCLGFWPLHKEIPWDINKSDGVKRALGKCLCDNWMVNELEDFIVDALPVIGQIGCYALMSSLKLVLSIGLSAIPGRPGAAINAGLDMSITAAQMASYVYPKDQDPANAFDFWLSPCGGSDFVPDDIKKVFEILNGVADGVSSFRKPKNIKQHSGRKGDAGNPQTFDRGTGRGRRPNNNNGSNNGKKRCNVPPAQREVRLGHAKNTLRSKKCVADRTVISEVIITSLVYARGSKPTPVMVECQPQWSQACYHYQSAISVNPQWSTLTCPQAAATTAFRNNAAATNTWLSQHNGAGWRDKFRRQWPNKCDRDEYPPAYLLDDNDPAFTNSGKNSRGQLIRYIPDKQNRAAGQMWKGACFGKPLAGMSDADFKDAFKHGAGQGGARTRTLKRDHEQTMAAATITQRPAFTITKFPTAPTEAGLKENPCWPSGIAPADPGFALLTYDPYYQGKQPPYNYGQKYVRGVNGA
ncbi:hypothetical protein QBC44DRAFT_373421 [Cladorrhinum sp. PSN332]|nr:hypothetical protein QBC44DRAFT_373421 [Cladorrhinum sp. PSN332]